MCIRDSGYIRSAAAYGTRHRGDCLILTYHASVYTLLKMQELFRLVLREPVHRYLRPALNDRRYIIKGYLSILRLLLVLLLLLLKTQLLRAQLGKLFVIDIAVVLLIDFVYLEMCIRDRLYSLSRSSLTRSRNDLLWSTSI